MAKLLIKHGANPNLKNKVIKVFYLFNYWFYLIWFYIKKSEKTPIDITEGGLLNLL